MNDCLTDPTPTPETEIKTPSPSDRELARLLAHAELIRRSLGFGTATLARELTNGTKIEIKVEVN